jgi:hypothetical protein
MLRDDLREGMHTDIEAAVTSWPGAVAAPHRFAGREFSLGGTEFGHVHTDRQIDIPFAKRVRDVVVGAGLADEHHLFPDSGWVTKYLRSTEDVAVGIDLLRVAYLYRVAASQRRVDVDPVLAAVDVTAELDAMALPAGLRETFPPLSAPVSAPGSGEAED